MPLASPQAYAVTHDARALIRGEGVVEVILCSALCPRLILAYRRGSERPVLKHTQTNILPRRYKLYTPLTSPRRALAKMPPREVTMMSVSELRDGEELPNLAL